MPELQDAPSRPRGLRKGELNTGLLDRGLDPLDLFELLHPALSLPGTVLSNAVAFDELLYLADAFLLILVGRLLNLLPEGLLLEVTVVVAGILLESPLFQLKNPGYHPVEKGSIVRDKHHGRPCGEQIFFEPEQGMQVQMVRGFIEKQQVRFGQQQPGELQAHGPAAAQGRNRPVHLFIGEAQSRKDFSGPRLEIVASEMLHLFVQMRLSFRQLSALLFPGSHLQRFLKELQFSLNHVQLFVDIHGIQ